MNKEEKVRRKRKKEQQVVGEMIWIYCKGKHGSKHHVYCKECEELLNYATMRSEKCPFMEKKTFCANCRVHCYKPEMRTKIKEVMRYAGPRITFHHPIMAMWHVISSAMEKHKLAKEDRLKK